MSSDLSIVCCNVRGLNLPARRETVKDLMQSAMPTIACLQESKLASIDATLAREFLGNQLSAHSYLPANGTRGGIVMAWNPHLVDATDLVLKDY